MFAFLYPASHVSFTLFITVLPLPFASHAREEKKSLLEFLRLIWRVKWITYENAIRNLYPTSFGLHSDPFAMEQNVYFLRFDFTFDTFRSLFYNKCVFGLMRMLYNTKNHLPHYIMLVLPRHLLFIHFVCLYIFHLECNKLRDITDMRMRKKERHVFVFSSCFPQLRSL